MDFLFILLVYRSIQFCLFSFFSKLLLRWIFVYSTFSDIAIKICYDKYSLYNLKLSYINTFSTITPVNPHLTPRYLQYRTPNPLNCSPHAVSQTFIKHIWFTPIPPSSGMNSIALYLGHELLGHVFPVQFRVSSQHANLLCLHIYGALLWMGVATLLHRNHLYITI